MLSEQMVLVEDASALTEGYEVRCWDDVPNQAVVMALSEKGSSVPMAVSVVGLNVARPLDEDYRAFLTMFKVALTSGLSAVRAIEREAMAFEDAKRLERAKESFFSNVAHEVSPIVCLCSMPDTYCHVGVAQDPLDIDRGTY